MLTINNADCATFYNLTCFALGSTFNIYVSSGEDQNDYVNAEKRMTLSSLLIIVSI